MVTMGGLKHVEKSWGEWLTLDRMASDLSSISSKHIKTHTHTKKIFSGNQMSLLMLLLMHILELEYFIR